jgi:hypothetical protein
MSSLNPITILDQILADYTSPKVRRLIHSLVLLVAALVTVYLAAGKDWKQAAIALAASLYAAANKANTPATTLDPAGHDSEPNDDLSYEDAGGADFPETHPEDDTPIAGFPGDAPTTLLS